MKYFAKLDEIKQQLDAPIEAIKQISRNPYILPNKAPDIIDKIKGPGIPND